jgi:acyl-CoA synthetase (AMP-forming)/AMP-acid ligase II
MSNPTKPLLAQPTSIFRAMLQRALVVIVLSVLGMSFVVYKAVIAPEAQREMETAINLALKDLELRLASKQDSAVSMAAVIGVPDPIRTEAIKAFIVAKPGVAPGDDLVRDLQAHVRTRLAAHEYPREIEFVSELPMTATGKIVRRELKRREAQKREGKTP